MEIFLDFVRAARTLAWVDLSLENAWEEALSLPIRLERILWRQFWTFWAWVTLRLDPFCVHGWKNFLGGRFGRFLARTVAEEEQTAERLERALALRGFLVSRWNNHLAAECRLEMIRVGWVGYGRKV
jgi:hypothetical protein